MHSLGRSNNRDEAEAERGGRLAIMCFAMIVRAQCDDVADEVGAALVQRHDVMRLKIDGAVCSTKPDSSQCSQRPPERFSTASRTFGLRTNTDPVCSRRTFAPPRS